MMIVELICALRKTKKEVLPASSNDVGREIVRLISEEMKPPSPPSIEEALGRILNKYHDREKGLVALSVLEGINLQGSVIESFEALHSYFDKQCIEEIKTLLI